MTLGDTIEPHKVVYQMYQSRFLRLEYSSDGGAKVANKRKGEERKGEEETKRGRKKKETKSLLLTALRTRSSGGERETKKARQRKREKEKNRKARKE